MHYSILCGIMGETKDLVVRWMVHFPVLSSPFLNKQFPVELLLMFTIRLQEESDR